MRELNFETPKKFVEAGVKFAIQTDATGSTISQLPLCAAMTIAYGLPWEAALKAVTISPAEILGVSNRVGSLEKGKDADIRILSGDPFDPLTEVQMVIIDGKKLVEK